MNLCLHQRLTEYTGDIRYAGQQAIEHDGLHRQDKGHDVRSIDALKIDGKRIIAARRSNTVRTEVLACSLEREVLYPEGRIGCAVSEVTLAERID